MEKIRFKGDLGEEIELYVIDTTKLAGEDYLLASDGEAGDGECYIFKDVSPEGSAEAVYEPVTDEGALDYLLSVFAEQLDDIDLQF